MTKEKDRNPFVMIGYVEPELFCDRKKELERLKSTYINNRHLVLLSQRRMGKTGLLRHFIHTLKNNKDVLPILIDVYATNNVKEFVDLLAKEILNNFDRLSTKIFKGFTKFFSSFSPNLSLDPLTGETKVSFNINTESEAQVTLDYIFSYLKKLNKTIILAFDEFQQVQNYSDTNIEAILRTLLQKYNDFTCVFSGSQKHMLLEMFTNHSRPFYQSAGVMHLDPIDDTSYISFIKHHFGKVKITSENVLYILRWCRSHTFYVQSVCNRLYASRNTIIDKTVINSIFIDILTENEVVYQDYKNLMSPMQFKIMAAIAKEGSVDKPTSSELLIKHKLGSPSSVQRALKSVVDKQMVYNENGTYYVSDVFFSNWLCRL